MITGSGDPSTTPKKGSESLAKTLRDGGTSSASNINKDKDISKKEQEETHQESDEWQRKNQR